MGRIVFAWNQGGRRGEGGSGVVKNGGVVRRNDPKMFELANRFKLCRIMYRNPFFLWMKYKNFHQRN
jgi:hypothetical protein